MKTAVVSTGLQHVARGVEAWARMLASELRNQNIDVTLFMGSGGCCCSAETVIWCLPRGTAANRLLSIAGARCGGWRYGFGSPYQIEQTTFSVGLIRELRRGCYDVVHLQDSWLAWLLECARRRGMHSAKVIVVNGTEDPVEFLRRFDHVQELSPTYYERHGSDVGAGKWFCVPNFVDTSLFVPVEQGEGMREALGLMPGDRVVLSVGALNRRKRVDWLIEECARIDDPFLRLVLCGAVSCEDGSDLLAAKARAILGGRVLILSDLDLRRMPEVYACADVFVLCSLQEIFGIVFLEAMACGVPCIGHTYPTTEWVIGGGGVTVDMQKQGALARVIGEMLANPCRSVELGRQGRKRAVDVFSQEAVTKQVIAMYEVVLGK
ncbi:MAG: glycosyltransferase family 4 protein [Lentisphaerae bacterium]|nr:glycosyltransferase family 4 protein [Lentisphaerota bacterium]